MEKMSLAMGQLRQLTDEILAFIKQLGVDNVQLNTPALPGETHWEYMALLHLRMRCEDAGLKLVASVAGLALLEYWVFLWLCGQARGRFDVAAPATAVAITRKRLARGVFRAAISKSAPPAPNQALGDSVL